MTQLGAIEKALHSEVNAQARMESYALTNQAHALFDAFPDINKRDLISPLMSAFVEARTEQLFNQRVRAIVELSESANGIATDPVTDILNVSKLTIGEGDVLVYTTSDMLNAEQRKYLESEIRRDLADVRVLFVDGG
ncbi:MAG: hypothetical protein ACRYF5_06430, partial [Janthinobacterium lividum]